MPPSELRQAHSSRREISRGSGKPKTARPRLPPRWRCVLRSCCSTSTRLTYTGSQWRRELEVRSLIAEGHSNDGICKKLVLSPKTVETHVRHILWKLRIGETPDYHRRVLAVLTYLRR